MQVFGEEDYGQSKPTNTLRRIFESKKIPHAFLFHGPKGTGKHFTAIQFIKLLNSEGIVKKEILSKIEKLNEPYIKYIFPLPRGKGETNENNATEKLSPDTLEQISKEVEKKSNNPFYSFTIDRAFNIKINSIRDIKKFLSYSYDDVKYRLVLISDAHKMNSEAQNALLKSLEEPPSGIIFILMTPYKEKLLETIQSRCWQINFAPLLPENIELIMEKFFDIGRNESSKVSIFSNGSVTEAIELLNKDFDHLLDRVVQILRYSLAGRYNTAFSEFSDLTSDKSLETYNQVLFLISNWFNDVNKNRYDVKENYSESYLDTLKKFNDRFRQVDINNFIEKLNYLGSAADKNVNLNLISLNIILELASIAKR